MSSEPIAGGARSARGPAGSPCRLVLSRLVLILLALTPGACSTPDEKKTPAQFIDENSTILRQLASFDDREQREGISRLQKLGRDQGTAVILYILSDSTLDDYRIEVVLARILADWKDPRAIGYLLRNMNSLDRGAEVRASEGLLAFGDNQQVIEALGEMLDRPTARERLVAAQTLVKIQSPRIADMFIPRFKKETDPEVRALYLLKVKQSRHSQRKSFLVDALTDPDLAIRSEAWSALKRYRDLPRVEFVPDGPLEDRATDVAMLRMWVKAGKGK